MQDTGISWWGMLENVSLTPNQQQSKKKKKEKKEKSLPEQ